MLIDQLVAVADPWAMFYNNSLFAQTAVTFGHFGGMVVSGGLALAADRSAIGAARATVEDKRRYLRVAGGVHKWVVFGLFLTIVSGVLMLGADLEIFITSRAFWMKMGLVGALLLNGMLIVRQEHKLTKTHPLVSRHWRRLRSFALTSLVLWLAVIFAGVTMTNI